MSSTIVLVATGSDVLLVHPETGSVETGSGVDGRRPTCLAAERPRAGSGTIAAAWCGTVGGGVLRTGDGGRTWKPAGLPGAHVTSLAVGPAEAGPIWAGTEPSAVFHSGDGGRTWETTGDLEELPSSPDWAFPPRPETHHVRWIACHPRDPGRLWVAIEAGALVRTGDGGRSWRDRTSDGPRDTHELAVHPDRPETLRVAAGDGYFESHDGGDVWTRPHSGFDVGYLRSVAIDPGDPGVVVVSASSRPRTAYVAGRSDGRLYRREGEGAWERVRGPWADPPSHIAPLLLAGRERGELWAADERGLYRSGDSARSWERVAAFDPGPANLRGIALLAEGGRP
jgi:photosystem II stability/assembly factor-like uncharacterized protein